MKHCLITGKGSFFDEQSAKQVAEKFSKTAGTKLRAYKCEFCKAWHFTHKKNFMS